MIVQTCILTVADVDAGWLVIRRGAAAADNCDWLRRGLQDFFHGLERFRRSPIGVGLLQ